MRAATAALLEFSYNLANLPEDVEETGGASLTYSYLCDGSKWRARAGPSWKRKGNRRNRQPDHRHTRVEYLSALWHKNPRQHPGRGQPPPLRRKGGAALRHFQHRSLRLRRTLLRPLHLQVDNEGSDGGKNRGMDNL